MVCFAYNINCLHHNVIGFSVEGANINFAVNNYAINSINIIVRVTFDNFDYTDIIIIIIDLFIFINNFYFSLDNYTRSNSNIDFDLRPNFDSIFNVNSS